MRVCCSSLVIGSRHVEKGDSKKGFSFIRNLGSRYAIKLTQKLSGGSRASEDCPIGKEVIFSYVNKRQKY